jgi:hypothetical protein
MWIISKSNILTWQFLIFKADSNPPLQGVHVSRFSWPSDLLHGQTVSRPMQDASTREKTCADMWAYPLARLTDKCMALFRVAL